MITIIYTGKMRNNNPKSNKRNYVLEGRLWNKVKGKHEFKYLDAGELGTGIARFINDACDTYSDKLPEKFLTGYTTNVGYRYGVRGWGGSVGHSVCGLYLVVCSYVYLHVYRTVINPDPHAELGFYMEVFALTDIPAYDELFARYGEKYWTPSQDNPPVSDPVKLTEASFYIQRTHYFQALSKKYTHLQVKG